MDNLEYLDFDQAVAFLKTTPSTLYKWLQAGKVPGHKLGRQWRFLKDELEFHVSGKAPRVQHQKELIRFAEFLQQRTKTKTKEGFAMDNLSEKLIWDAFDRGVREIHIAPRSGKYEITYRQRHENVESQTLIEESLLQHLDEAWTEQSSPLKSENRRRFVLHRSENENVQVQYRKVETITGPHIALFMLEPNSDIMPFEKIMADTDKIEKVKSWLQRKKALIIVAGAAGSGKTTTVFSMMDELRRQGKVIFTLESSAPLVFDGVNQVEYSPRNTEDFTQNLLAVWAANPDAVIFGMGETHSLENDILKAAGGTAKDGGLAILQLNADSIQQAAAKFEDSLGEELKGVPVGIIWQELEKTTSNKLKARYEIIEKLSNLK